ncbi:Photosystem I chlorophyll a apoprotein A1 [Capsicum annuum]|uniref:Photosystem I chlorophyll a apoprotein A1 n=1 Tax=Capsicum annuum TaxID=4072 RepID=A0A2G3AJY4_CAPAN|nr:Photosystem I chlorophyll a apoprotein A1 [Capsicum annuum]
MIIRSPKPEVKILVDRGPVKSSFEEWARAGHFSRTIAKGPDTTTWIWNLHADAQDFNSHTSELDEISQRVFSACFGQLSIIFLGLSGMYFHGARFPNYEAWLSDPTHIGPSALVVWQIVGQEILNDDVIYKTNWGIGNGLKDILEAHKGPFIGQGHKGLYEILTTSWHAQLPLNLAMLGSLTIVVAHHMYVMPPYPYLATDYGTQLSLFIYHIWIGGFIIVGAAAHATIFMVRDYDPTTQYNDLLDRVFRHRDAIISHLN